MTFLAMKEGDELWNAEMHRVRELLSFLGRQNGSISQTQGPPERIQGGAGSRCRGQGEMRDAAWTVTAAEAPLHLDFYWYFCSEKARF